METTMTDSNDFDRLESHRFIQSRAITSGNLKLPEDYINNLDKEKTYVHDGDVDKNNFNINKENTKNSTNNQIENDKKSVEQLNEPHEIKKEKTNHNFDDEKLINNEINGIDDDVSINNHHNDRQSVDFEQSKYEKANREQTFVTSTLTDVNSSDLNLKEEQSKSIKLDDNLARITVNKAQKTFVREISSNNLNDQIQNLNLKVKENTFNLTPHSSNSIITSIFSYFNSMGFI
jgi:hypothetical protein